MDTTAHTTNRPPAPPAIPPDGPGFDTGTARDSMDRPRELLWQLIGLWGRLDLIGGPEEDGELFEQVITIEDELLGFFSLPPSDDHLAFLRIDTRLTVTPGYIDHLLGLLAGRAAEYQAWKMKRDDLQILRSAAIFNREPGTVLPKIGISNHVYQYYLYYQIDTRSDEQIRSILDEMRAAEPHLNDIGVADINSEQAPPGLVEGLRRLGLPHLPTFLTRRRRRPIRVEP